MSRNLLNALLIHAGAAYVAAWATLPLSLIVEALFPPAVVSGEWGVIFLALRSEVPVVIVWLACAALAASVTAMARPMAWAVAFAAFLVLVRISGWNWTPETTLSDRAAFVVPSIVGGVAVTFTYVRVFRRTKRNRSMETASAA
jgi:hypothetical protein